MGKKKEPEKASAKATPKAPLAPSERPPRPSHGHKWDEEKQEWVGRGTQEERKAAKMNAGLESKQAADGTVLKGWQKMPTQLLLEWTKSEKRPNPRYVFDRPWDQSQFRKRVILQDPKNDSATLDFAPYDDSESEAVAKEHAALVALLKVQSTMPLERKLPDLYADIWKASIAEATPNPKAKAKSKAKAKAEAKAETAAEAADGASGQQGGRWRKWADGGSWAASGAEAAAEEADDDLVFKPPDRKRSQQQQAAASSKPAAGVDGRWTAPVQVRAASEFSSKAERNAAQAERQKERNKREAIRDAKRRANMPAPILLARKMRTQLSKALRLQDKYFESGESSTDVEMDDVEAEAMTKCVEWGFASTDVMRALVATKEDGASSSSGNELALQLRQWLCLYLPEEELPEEFAAGRGQFDVHPSSAVAPKAPAHQKQTPLGKFEASRSELISWLRTEMSSKLSDSDVDALHASVEAVLLGFEPASADDGEAEEVGENAAIILSSEGDELEALGVVFQERWKEVWTTFNSNEAGAKDVDDNIMDVSTAIDSEFSDDDTVTVVSDGFWENGAQGSAEGQCRRAVDRQGPWFGSDAGKAWLVAAEAEFGKSAAGQRMQKQRDELPAAKSKDELTSLSNKNAIVLIQGETGCGKTTQVGQFLLESDRNARVVVTQPRRVAATSVAQRVAQERGEQLGQGSVGYSVRGETKMHRSRGRLLFCTNGVLLRRLLGEPGSMFSDSTCTHLIVDEVHERSVEIDLLLTLLRHFLPKRPNLRVFLMSATMDVKQLTTMFEGKPPIVKIPGRTFPVTQVFLESIEDQLDIYTYGGSGGGAKNAKAYKDDDEGGDIGLNSTASGVKFLRQLDFGSIADLALAIIHGKLRDAPRDGALLIFVPGVSEIERIRREIQHRSDPGEVFTLPLHGNLPPDQQRKCFEVASKGGPRKVVISTNVAETSVTVPDVTVVIDTARERRLLLTPGAAAPCLTECVCARSSLTQRRGRAGRVRAGLCVTMLPQKEYEGLPAEAPPEIESAALESVCLQVRVSGFDPSRFLSQMPTPPHVDRVAEAEALLTKIGATVQADSKASSTKEVTALGRHLCALPVDVHIGKLLVVGAFLGVTSMVLNVAAMLSIRSPLKNTAREPKVEAWRTRLQQSLRPGGTKSDHCLYSKLLQLWTECKDHVGRKELCQNAGLVWEGMSEATSIRSQLASAMRGLGFDVKGGDDRNTGDWRALRVAVTAAFYPQIAKILRPIAEYADGLAGAVEKQSDAKKLRYFVRTSESGEKAKPTDVPEWRKNWENEMRGFLHPGSLLFKENSYSCPYVVFSSKQLQQTRGDYSTRLNLSQVTEASIYALLLFGGKLSVDHNNNQLFIDNWIVFSGGSTTVMALVEALRKEIDKLLLQKIEEPWLRLGDSAVCQAVTTLVSTDGLG